MSLENVERQRRVTCKRDMYGELLAELTRRTTASLEVDLEALGESQCDELVPALAEAVASHPTMEFLTVKGFAVLSDFAGQELVESLSQAKHLKMLVLKGDYIATDTMLALADALSTNRTLEGLAVGATFPDEEVGPALGEALAVNASLKTVVLEGDLVGDATGLAVAGALKSNRTLINLAVHGDLVGNETGLAMAGVLLENRTLASLKLEGATLGDPTNRAFAEVLCAPASQLWSLEVSGGCFSDETGRALAKVLEIKGALRSLSIRARRIAGLASCGCRALSSVLQAAALESLEVTCAGAGDAASLAQALRGNRALRSLTVHGHIADAGMQAFAEALLENTRLQSLCVRGDGTYSAVASRAMGKALRTNTTVTTLELVGVKGWPPGAASAALQRNRELPQLWRHVALVALRSEHCGLNVAVDSMTARGFRIAVFSFFLPKRPPSHRVS